MSLVEGEYIKNIEECDDGWWSGVGGGGKTGLFPCLWFFSFTRPRSLNSLLFFSFLQPTLLDSLKQLSLLLPEYVYFLYNTSMYNVH